MRMAAVIVVIVAVAMVMIVTMMVVVIMVVMIVTVMRMVMVGMIMMRVVMAVVVAMMMRMIVRLRRRRRGKSATLDPDETRAERRDQRVACDFDDALGRAHRLAGDVQEERADADDHHRDNRLQQRGGKRQHNAAPRGFFIGQKIRRDHRLAVAGACRVENAVEKRHTEQRRHRAAVGLGGADRPRHGAVELRLLFKEPADDATCLQRGSRRRAWPAERRTLRQKLMQQAVADQHQHGKHGEQRRATAPDRRLLGEFTSS